MTDEVKRTTVIVRDTEMAAQWYEGVQGMSRRMDVPFTLSGNQLATGKKGDQTGLMIMKAEHDTIGMIGLLQWINPKRDDIPAELPTEIPFGTPIFVVAPKDAKATVERARAAGLRMHAEPLEWSVTGADGRQKDMTGVSFLESGRQLFEVKQLVGIHD